MEKYELIPGQLLHEGTIKPAQLFEPRICPREILELTHTKDYIDAVEAGTISPSAMRRIGFRWTPEMVIREKIIMKGTVDCALHALKHGFALNIAGGTHHAFASHGEGFCIFNDFGVAANYLLQENLASKIVILDLDVHQGNGTAALFEGAENVLTISLHENGRTLFPGTGWPGDTGGPHAPGTAVNVALPAGTGDNQWLRAFNAVVPDLLEAFEPEFLVTQHGCDSHFEDPLAHLLLSVDGQRSSYHSLHRLAHRVAGGRWVAVGGGGYAVVEVVPRAWTHLIAEALHAPIPPKTETPDDYRTFVHDLMGRPPPLRMTDGRDPWGAPFERNYHPEDPLDRAIFETRRATFPHYGLMADPFGAF